MRRILTALLPVFIISTAAQAEEGKGIRFWNLTASTITSLKLSPAGQKAWGANQVQNDRDGGVDYDERLKITGVEPGLYDVKFHDKLARECIQKNISIKANEVFSIHEKSLPGTCTLTAQP